MKKTMLFINLLSTLLTFLTISPIGQIIVIQGYFSGGKTSIMQKLTVNAPENIKTIYWDPYLNAKMNETALKFGYTLDPKNSWNHFYTITAHLTPEERAKFSAELFKGFCLPIKELAQNGNIVFIEGVADYNIDNFLEIMKDIKITFVFIYTPLDKVIEFIKVRMNSITNENKGSLLISLDQYQSFFKPVENENDIVVDTLYKDDILRHLDYMNNESCWYREKPENFEKNFLKHFKLDQFESVQITPVFSYDIILHHAELPPFERSQILKNLLKI